jgi:menaquinone-dependent protoporphyrinogen oxidase
MPVLVVYASKHGSTRGIAERIAAKLTEKGHPAEARSVQEASGLEGYNAFVIGSAAYGFHWMDEALAFVKSNSAVLKRVPVWLFSSGPLGNEATDQKGRDLLTATVPKEIPELQGVVEARGHRVFFGALDPDTLGFAERALRKLPAARAALPEGDFRDWDEIDAWAAEIASDLAGPQPE